MKKRKILHIDINHCFAQIIEMMYPSLKDVPMAVGGSEESRNGIILARNLKAKEFGVSTAETLREAKDKCPNLVIVPPKYEYFMYYSEKVKDIYREYSDKVESFGIDEAWIDLSNSEKLFGDAEKIGREIQTRVLNEIGLTVSCGLSFNKVFAKLGSDMVKPSGFVVITEENYPNIVWPLAASDLLYVGKATSNKLANMNINTIGDIANCDKEYIKKHLGKNGEMIYYFANGYDLSDVLLSNFKEDPKSVGNSITTSSDMRDFNETKIVFQVLVESVASRLRDNNLKGDVIKITLRDTKLKVSSHQMKINKKTYLAFEIMEVVIQLLRKNYYYHLPLRSIGVSVSNLSSASDYYQFDLFTDEIEIKKRENIEVCIDDIRRKFGFDKIQRLSLNVNKDLTDFNPKKDHVIFPASWF